MGSHSKTAHKPGAIAPALPHFPVQELLMGQTVCLDASDLVYQMVSYCKEHPAPEGSLAGWYGALTAKAESTAQAIASAEAAGGSAEAIEQMRDLLHLAVSSTLNGLPKDQLIELATVHGFEHPALAALGDTGPYPLSHWLDPTYAKQAPSKLDIQVKALERYAALCKGETIAGIDLAALQALEGASASDDVIADSGTKASDPPSGTPPPATSDPSVPAKVGSPTMKPATGFAAKHKQLVAALAHVKATTADLPPHIEASAVASFEFGTGKAAVLGGMHAKTIHTGPDGGNWLFKPDKQARGARAHAEAAASALLHAAGVPSVPVYAVTIGGKPGAVQPLIHGATQLDPDPASWTQAEADAIVRYHVAAWLAGDHDGKPDNVLRTPSGGLVPIDQGQAFKFYGTDKLDMSFHPNATYGAERPVYHQLYEAHLNGALGPGVTINPLAAHPVIKQYEKMPDTQLRAILHDTAHQGAASGVVAWIPAMRVRAASKHGVSESAVTKTQIAEAFLDHACERKHALRSAFADFFTSQVKLPAAAALRHGA